MAKPLRRVMCSSACAAGAIAAAKRAAERARRRVLVRRGTVMRLPERVVGEQGCAVVLAVEEAGLSTASAKGADFGRDDKFVTVRMKARTSVEMTQLYRSQRKRGFYGHGDAVFFVGEAEVPA